MRSRWALRPYIKSAKVLALHAPMAPQNNVNSPAFELHLPNVVRVAGETIQGRVELNVARAQDDGIESLCINLRGSIVTYVPSSSASSLLTNWYRTIIESNTDGSDTKHERTIEVRLPD
jgi:hypothetical protein